MAWPPHKQGSSSGDLGRCTSFASGNQPVKLVKFCTQKYSTCIFLKIGNYGDIPLRHEGRIADVTYAKRGCGGRGRAEDERCGARTAKSCGPDAPKAGAQVQVKLTGFTKDDGGNRQGSPGRSRISRKTTAQGRPV